MADKRTLTADQAKEFVSQMQGEHYSDEEITSYLKDHIEVKEPEKTFWQRHPTMEAGTRSALRIAPMAGMLTGGVIGSGAGPVGTGAGAMLGAAGGEALANAGESVLGLEPPKTVIRGLGDAANAASVAGLTEGLSAAAARPAGSILKKAGPYIEELGARAGKGRGINILPGGKVVDLAVSDAVKKGGQLMTKAGLRLAPSNILSRTAGLSSTEDTVAQRIARPALGSGSTQLPAPAQGESFVRGVPASHPVSERLALPEPAIEGEIVQPKGAVITPKPLPVERPALPPSRATRALPEGKPLLTQPPADTSGVQVTRAAKTEFPVRDPATGRMRRTFTSDSEGSAAPVKGETPPAQTAPKATPAKPKADLKGDVQRLSKEGYGAEDIADQLKDHPELKGAPKAERVNRVREMRGGPSGELPARAKQAIDEAFSKLTSQEDRRAFLLKAPNARAYDYILDKMR